MPSRELRPLCDCLPVYETRHEDEKSSAANTVREAVAAAEGVEGAALAPLNRYVDPEMIDELIEPATVEATSGKVLCCRVEGWNVFVRADGAIRVCDPDTTADVAPIFERPVNR